MNKHAKALLFAALSLCQIADAKMDDYDMQDIGVKKTNQVEVDQLPPVQIPPIQEVQSFHRLFKSYRMVQFNLSTDLSNLWKYRQKANSPEDPVKAKHFEKGTITIVDEKGKQSVVPVKVKLRGNTSQAESECPFPKLKLNFDSSDAAGTILEGLTSVSIGTHCGDQGGASAWLGRIWNGLSPHRESLLYRSMALAGIYSFKSRPAMATYEDTGSGRVYNNKQAFFLEDLDTLLETHQMKEIQGADVDQSMRKTTGDVKYVFRSVHESPKISLFEVGKMYLFQSMIGNADWKLRVNPNDVESQSIWNVKVVEMNGGEWFAFCYDFDLTGPVRGKWNTKRDNLFRERFPPEVRRTVVQHFQNAKNIFYSLESELSHDPEGARYYRESLNRFYQNLGNHL